MKVVVSYVKAKATATYVSAVAAVSYTKAIVSNVYSAAAEGLESFLVDSVRPSESGFLFTQDYVDDTYFEEVGYIASESRSF